MSKFFGGSRCSGHVDWTPNKYGFLSSVGRDNTGICFRTKENYDCFIYVCTLSPAWLADTTRLPSYVVVPVKVVEPFNPMVDPETFVASAVVPVIHTVKEKKNMTSCT